MANDNKNQYPKVGIGVMIWKDGKILLGKRKSLLARGEYAFPGGHLEYMESLEECARREVREETGMEIQSLRFLFCGNLKAYAPHHYVQFGFMADWESGEPKTMEPDKCERWDWYDPEHLPAPLLATISTYLAALKTGQTFWDE